MASTTITGIDTRQLSAFSAACRKAAVIVRSGMSRDLSASGEIVGEQARRNASQHSKTIAGTIRVRRRVSVSIIEAGAGDPIAGLYEYGNKGSRGARTFGHPVFGDENSWVRQRRYPFLRPAVDETFPEIAGLVDATASETVDMIAHGS